MSAGVNVSTIALRTCPLFQGLPDEALARVAQVASMRCFPRGQAVVREGESCDYVYFVLTGHLKVVVSNEDGREVILSLLEQGELFGEMSMFGDQPRSASVVAVTSADLMMIAKGDFRLLMEEHFELAWRLMCNLADRLRAADRKIENLALLDVYGRVARLLLDMAEDVHGERRVKRKVSKQDIARMIGASREMVSRVMKELGQRGLIEESSQGILLHEGLQEL